MKTIKNLLLGSIPVILLAFFILYFVLRPVFSFAEPAPYAGTRIPTAEAPVYDATKKTVMIIADNKLTELFDMLAPFYLFNSTEKFNVYIVAKEQQPIRIRKDLFVLPHLTFQQADSLQLPADVIVIPALSVRDEHQDPAVVSFIKNHVGATTKVLAVCDGAATAAATGLYDGKPLTCHASDFKRVSKHFSKPKWVQNVSVTRSGNLYSTAGVSNAVDGSLTIIKDMLGQEAMEKVAENIGYPHATASTAHESIPIGFSSVARIARKVVFGKNRQLGLLLQTGVNEFEMASILDTYARTFPKSFRCFTEGDSIVQTKYGLTLLHTGGNTTKPLDELHVLTGSSATEASIRIPAAATIHYEHIAQYPIEACLQRISGVYGAKFEQVVKLMLDYN